MIVLLLFVIVCIMLFGKESVKSGIGALIGTIFILALLGSCMS